MGGGEKDEQRVSYLSQVDVAAGLRCHGCRTVGHAAGDGLVQVRVHVEAAARHEDHGQHGQAEQQRQHARHQTHPLAPAGCCISLSQCPLQPQAPCQPQLQSGYRGISYKVIAPSHKRLSLIFLKVIVNSLTKLVMRLTLRHIPSRT